MVVFVAERVVESKVVDPSLLRYVICALKRLSEIGLSDRVMLLE